MKILILLFLSLKVFAFQEFDLPEGKWWRNEDVIRELQLTEDQQKQLEKIFYNHLEKAIDLRAKIEKEELKLRELLDQNTIVEKQVLSQVETLLDARKEIEKIRAELFLKVRMLLTYEQWQKVKNRFQKKIKIIREEKKRFRNNPPPIEVPLE